MYMHMMSGDLHFIYRIEVKSSINRIEIGAAKIVRGCVKMDHSLLHDSSGRRRGATAVQRSAT